MANDEFLIKFVVDTPRLGADLDRAHKMVAEAVEKIKAPLRPCAKAWRVCARASPASSCRAARRKRRTPPVALRATRTFLGSRRRVWRRRASPCASP